MPTGRCAGCGRIESLKKAEQHALTCPEYLKRYREHPESCLDPGAEFVRFKTEDDTSEARAERRDQRLQKRFADMDEQHARQAQRWQRPKDLLED